MSNSIRLSFILGLSYLCPSTWVGGQVFFTLVSILLQVLAEFQITVRLNILPLNHLLRRLSIANCIPRKLMRHIGSC